MIAEFFAWWAEQMRGLAPTSIRDGQTTMPDGLVIDASGLDSAALPHALPLLRRSGRKERPAGAARLDATSNKPPEGPVTLRIPPAMLLERSITLPLAAERDLDRVVGYQMDQLTPFAAQEVFWAAEMVERDRARGRLDVRLSLVPKIMLADLLAGLALGRIPPNALEIVQPGLSPRRIALSHGRSSAERRRRLAGFALVALSCGLALAAVIVPLVRQSLALAAVEERIDSLRPRVAEAEALRKRIADNSTGADAIAAESARVGDVLQAVAALTDILPDDTHLTDLKLRQRKVTMNGQSAAAARLIAALSADPTIRNPAFMAPVTRAIDNRGDVFAISAELGP